MLISKENRVVFVHIPRTGGTSVRRALRAQQDAPYEPNVQKIQHTITALLPVTVKHILANCLQATPLRYLVTGAGHPTMVLMRLLRPEVAEYRSFAFVRNPYDRIVSAYEFACATNEYGGSFDEYVRHCLCHLQPQSNYLYLGGRRLVDFIGRFERFEEDFHDLCARLGLGELNLAHVGETTREAYLDYFTPRTLKKVEKAYAADFALFEYPLLTQSTPAGTPYDYKLSRQPLPRLPRDRSSGKAEIPFVKNGSDVPGQF